MDNDQHTVDAARRAAEQDLLAEWVAAFLRSPGSDNAALGQQLNRDIRHWIGPVELPLDQLKRFAGPEGEPVVVEVDDDYWDDRVDDLAEKIDDGFEPAPLIVAFRDGGLHLEDGNHRVESLRRSGATEGWAVVGFEDEELLEQFLERIDSPDADLTG